MANGDIPSWEEWNEQLTEDQRNYSLYKTLQSMDKRMKNLEKKNKFDTGCSIVGGMVGGFIAIIGKWTIGK